MTTGGGWQDQIGSVYGGFKLSTSCGKVPMELHIEHLTLPPDFITTFNARCCLVYTGVQRLAKDTLFNVLRHHASRLPGKNFTVHNLIKRTFDLRDVLLCIDTDTDEKIDSLGNYIAEYWCNKKAIASGTDTPVIRALLEATDNIIVGGCACGAGAGGFVFLLLQRHSSIDDVKLAIRGTKLLEKCTVHKCAVNEAGVLLKCMS